MIVTVVPGGMWRTALRETQRVPPGVAALGPGAKAISSVTDVTHLRSLGKVERRRIGLSLIGS
eukprot:420509-Rhodomonas_salina.1